MPDGPAVLSADDIEEVHTLAPSDVEEVAPAAPAPPKQYPPIDMSKVPGAVPGTPAPSEAVRPRFLRPVQPGEYIDNGETRYERALRPNSPARVASSPPAPSTWDIVKAVAGGTLPQSEEPLLPGVGPAMSAAQSAKAGRGWDVGSHLLEAGGEVATPFVGPALGGVSTAGSLPAALKFGGAIAASAGLPPVAQKISEKLGAGPAQQQFWANLAAWAPLTYAALRGGKAPAATPETVPAPEGGPTPGNLPGGGAAPMPLARPGAGPQISPAQSQQLADMVNQLPANMRGKAIIEIHARTGNEILVPQVGKNGQITNVILKLTEAPQGPPPVPAQAQPPVPRSLLDAAVAQTGAIKADLAANPPTRAELAEAQQQTNYAGPRELEAQVIANRQAQRAAAVSGEAAAAPAGGKGAVQPPAAPAPSATPKPVAAQPKVRPARPASQPSAGPAAAEAPVTPPREMKPSEVEVVKPQSGGENAGQAAETGGPVAKPATPKETARTPDQPARVPPAQATVQTPFKEGDAVTLPDGRRAKVDYVAPADKTPTVRVRTDDGEKVSLTRQKEIDQLQPATQFKHRSTQADIHPQSEAGQALEDARSRISKSDLAGKGKDIGGNHVTVRYGFLSPDTDTTNVNRLKKYISSLAPFEASLGKTEAFPPSESSDGAAVIHAPIEAPELHQINKEMANHAPFTAPTFKEYKPHATVAYVDPAKANRYVGMDVTAGKKFTIDKIGITDRNGNVEMVKLEGKSDVEKPSQFAVGQRVRNSGDQSHAGVVTKIEGDKVTVKLDKPQSGGFGPHYTTSRKNLESADEFVQSAYKRQKMALTRAQNLPGADDRKQAVLAAAKQAVKEWGKNAWPDDWSRWQRALEDVGIHAQLEDLETASEADLKHGPLVIKSIRGTTEPVKKPVTPQVPSETKYVLPSFVTKGLTQGPEKAEPGGAPALARAVHDKLTKGESLGNVTEFNKLAEQHLGGSRVSGAWTPKDAFDAMEAGVNKYLLDHGKALMGQDARNALDFLKGVESRLTSQATRTEGQIKAQQFSTPPRESYVAARVAAIKPSDVVLEPSAGNGGLAVWPKAIGAEVHVNEIAAKRQEMLQEVGFGKPTAHDGEIINSLLDQKIKPTVILMNPPFSSGVLKGENVKNSNQYGFNHVNSALQRLEPGGRLVAILGGGQANEPEGGASLRTGGSREWFQKIAQTYNIRANVRINGKEYQKYGTNFATRIIVIDKDGPTPDATNYSNGRVPASIVQKNVDTLEEAYTALREVAESRPSVGGAYDTTRREGTRPETDIERAGGARQPEASSGRGADQSLSPTGVRVPAGGERETAGAIQPADRRNQPDRSAGTVQPSETGQRTPVREPGPAAQKPDEAAAAESARGGSPAADQERPLRQPEVEGLVLGHEARSVREQEDSSAYVTYKPTLKGPAHPGSIVETKTMSTVPMPPITYHSSLPESVIKEGKLSAVQLEAVSIAGQQNDIVLPSGHRASALIGDGTGVGKGREGAAILWDNWNKGRKRLVWVSEKWDLMEDAKRDLNGIGATELAKNVKAFQKFGVTDPIEHEGVLFTTYALIRSEDAKGNSRAVQLQKWLRGKDEAEGAYMLFDESHNLKNAVVGQMGVASEIGKTTKKLLEDNPKLRTVSLSATAASDVMNLGYLDRLGLWGAGTPFPNGFGEFAANISGGGISAMEMVARELKAQGKYVSRTLSYKGVTYNEVEHKLTADQKELYRTAVKAWRSVVQQAEKTIKETNNGGHRAVARFMSLFYGAQLRFFNVLLTTLKIPTVVADANKALADGKSVVITLVNTNEAAQNREKNRERVKAADDDEIPDYDFGPAQMLTDLVREHYPTQQYADGVDDNGNKIKIPVVDADGNPVHNPQAIKEKNDLLAQIKKDLKLPKNPLDILLDSFGGPSKAAELTGRKERFDDNTGKFVKRGDANVKRDEVNLSEMRAFQEGKKRVAILSNAAGTGISLHADTNAKNRQKRHHITLQLGWSADKAMQMLGRTHRANQTEPPEYNTIVSDLGGEKRFSAVIAKRLGNLGALSKGQKDANASADAMEKTNFDSDQGKKATQTFYKQLMRNQNIPGTEGWDKDNPTKTMTGMSVLRDLAVLKKDPQTGIESVPDADQTNVTRLLNRLLALDPDIQNAVYDYYYDIFTAVVTQAVEDGTLDTGVKALKGDTFNVQEERALSTDPATGAKTFYYPVEAQVRTDRVPPKDVEKLLKKGVGARVMQNDKGKLALVRPAADIVHADGHTSQASYVVYPHNGVQQKVENYRLQGFKEVGEVAAERKATLEKSMEDAKGTLEYQKRTAERYGNDSWATARVKETEERMDRYEKELKELGSGDPQEVALGKWKEAYDAAPAHETEEHHLLGGAVLRWWNQIREAIPGTLDIYTTVDSTTGKRVVGVEIPKASIRNLLDRISGSTSTVDSGQLSTDVIKNNLQYELEQGIQVRKGRVNGNAVIQLIPSSDNVATNLKRLGVLYEKGITPVYYIPMKTKTEANQAIVDQVLEAYPVKQAGAKPEDQITGEAKPDRSGERGSVTTAGLVELPIAAVKAALAAKKVYSDFISKAIDKTLDLGDKYRRVADHDPVIAKALKEKDNAPRYFHDKAESNVQQVIQGLSESQIRLASMMVDNQTREYLQEQKPDEYNQSIADPQVMTAVQRFKRYQDELAAVRVALGWHVRRDLSIFEDEEGKWKILDPDGNEVEGEEFKTAKAAQAYVDENGKILDHLKRTYPEHLREPLMGRTDEGPSLGGSYGGIKPPRPDKKQRIASAEYFYIHGAKDFGGYIKSFTQAYHAALNQKIYDSLTEEATPWKQGTAMPPEITYRGETYYSPNVAKSMKTALPAHRPKIILEYKAYDPAKDDRALIKDFENGWSTQTTGRPGISPTARWLAPAEVVDALERYDMTRGMKENDSIRRFFQDQIVGLFGPTVHVFNIMRRLATTVGSGVWDPRVWPYYYKLFASKELRERMAQGLADDAIDYLSKWGSYTNTRDIGSLHEYFLGNLNPANWVRKFSKGILFDPKFLGGLGGLDQKARVLAYDFLREQARARRGRVSGAGGGGQEPPNRPNTNAEMSDDEAAKQIEDAFGRYNRANWTERMKRWAWALLFPGWDFSSLAHWLRMPIKVAVYPALFTMGINLALNEMGKNKDSDKYDYAYIHYGDRKYGFGLIKEPLASHVIEPVMAAARAALEGGDARDISAAAGQGVLRGGGGLAGNLLPEIQAAAELLSNRQYMGGQKEIWKPQDASIPGKVLPTKKWDEMMVFAVVKAFPAVNRFLDSSYENVDLATGAGSMIGVTNYKSGAEERLKANEAKAMGYSEIFSKLEESDQAAAEAFVQDPKKAVYILFNADLSELAHNLKDIDDTISRVKMAGSLSQKERKEILTSTANSRIQLLNSADALDEQLSRAKMRKVTQ